MTKKVEARSNSEALSCSDYTMPPSQLKRLKASLREQGITGPQKSKKQKQQASKNGQQHIQRSAALQQIRDSFNPFELKAPARPEKFESVSHTSANATGKKYKDVLHRPGVVKSAGEEMRRRNLLPEMQRRNKVGGLIDRRIGENDPDMTAEERAVQRFAQEKKARGTSLFDLEGSDNEPNNGLTHLGKSLDDFDAGDPVNGMSSESEDDGFLLKKRRRSDEDGPTEIRDEPQEEPERKKTKKEVMEEVIAKSKMHKYERQKAKEDDDDIREDLDKGLTEVLALLQGHKPQPSLAVKDPIEPTINPDRQKLLDGVDRRKAEKDYELRLRQLAQDTRAKPSDRTKTAEEKAQEQAQKLQKLEELRERRMNGEEISDEEGEVAETNPALVQLHHDAGQPLQHEVFNQAAEFGLTSREIPTKVRVDNVVLDDEDEFAYEEDIIADASDYSMDDESEDAREDDSETGGNTMANAEQEEDEFVKGILGTDANSTAVASNRSAERLSYTYPCPQSHREFLEVIGNSSADQVPTIVQRIRALHHPSLSAANKESMANFCTVLVDHIAYMGLHKHPLSVVENLIRHLHSLSRTYPDKIAEGFRHHLQQFHERGHPTAGDLIILTAIGSIYPTSDHFHQVVTPAITLIARWLSLSQPSVDQDAATGAFLVALSLKYQRHSKRYIPEVTRFTLQVLSLNPAPTGEQLKPHLDNLVLMGDLWKDKSALTEMLSPFIPLLKRSKAKKEEKGLAIALQQSRLRRRPLQLHDHRPQPIRTLVPKFEEGFNPDKHYDPDKERSESKKLQKEYKREKKGAVRELRKDANFIAREQLKDKRLRDEEYEKKQRRLIAEIQGEEGREAKEYDRERRRRKSGK
nr:putative nucleolar complex protein 14 [Quercus suber]POF20069.1 putative nucleolar complex protein 14 [Quercus suber]